MIDSACKCRQEKKDAHVHTETHTHTQIERQTELLVTEALSVSRSVCVKTALRR